MAGGHAGKILFVDLSSGVMKDEKLDEKMSREYLGGYGIGARILYNRQKPGVDPLGPENTLGMMSGLLTGTPIPTGARYQVIGKSPITGGWGDANSGGEFGPYMKFAGYDGVFFTGISPNPVYLLLDNGKAELKDAGKIWGMDAYETEDALMAEYGKDSRVACIGPAGERVNLIASIMTDHGSAAGRSGLGAVMGSKKLKAVVARGTSPVPLADKETIDKLRSEQLKQWQMPGPGGRMNFTQMWHKYGTSGGTATSAHSGDTPVKNWGGVGVIDVPDVSEFTGDAILAKVVKTSGCWHCPIACKALIKEGTGEYKYAANIRRPEYETLGVFGVNCGNNNEESINKVNDICNRAGFDTISAGSVVAFAIECYENGILTKKDTDGIELKWGNHQSIVAITEQMAAGKGLGAILAGGVKKAAEKIGKGSEKFAVHIGGQELGMHDPRLVAPFGGWTVSQYQMDATPGRHMANFGPGSFRGHVVNALGVCTFGWGFPGGPGGDERFIGLINGVTGWDMTMPELMKAGERIAVIRHVFNLREGINPLKHFVHPRILGKPPLTAGPLAGVTPPAEAQIYWNLGALDWDRNTTKPSRAKLLSLGLNDIAQELWPPMPPPPM
jgi:aldehyde:ferredoxin oxidoreductase